MSTPHEQQREREEERGQPLEPSPARAWVGPDTGLRSNSAHSLTVTYRYSPNPARGRIVHSACGECSTLFLTGRPLAGSVTLTLTSCLSHSHRASHTHTVSLTLTACLSHSHLPPCLSHSYHASHTHTAPLTPTPYLSHSHLSHSHRASHTHTAPLTVTPCLSHSHCASHTHTAPLTLTPCFSHSHRAFHTHTVPLTLALTSHTSHTHTSHTHTALCTGTQASRPAM